MTTKYTSTEKYLDDLAESYLSISKNEDSVKISEIPEKLSKLSSKDLPSFSKQHNLDNNSVKVNANFDSCSFHKQHIVSGDGVKVNANFDSCSFHKQNIASGDSVKVNASLTGCNFHCISERIE